LKNFTKLLLNSALALFLFLIAIEIGIQLYVDRIIKRSRMYVSDSLCGWRLLPNLDIERLNSKKEIFHIVTDRDGIRGISPWGDDFKKKILILGDSLAFGEGVDVSDRFDSIISGLQNNFTILNLAVSGYGTDQEFIAGRKYFPNLKEGDVLLIVSSNNDFYDILSKSSISGRPKPWFEFRERGLKEFHPRLGFGEFLADNSFIFFWLKLKSFLGAKKDSDLSDGFSRGLKLYAEIMKTETADLRKKKVFIVIAFFGKRYIKDEEKALVDNMFKDITQQFNIKYISLDDVLLKYQGNPYFLPCCHWGKELHKVVAYALNEFLKILH